MQIHCESATDHRDALRILQTFNIDYQTGIGAGGKMFFDIDESAMSRGQRDNLVESLTTQTCVDVIGDAGEIDEDLIPDSDDDEDEDDEDADDDLDDSDDEDDDIDD